MMRKNEGITLVEVLVSIAISGILFVTVLSILTTTNKISISNERKVNTINEVESIFDLFSSDPQNFDSNIYTIYKVTGNTNETFDEVTYRIYYTKAFIRIRDNDISNYYLDVKYTTAQIDQTSLYKYQLKIEIYHNNTLFTIDNYEFNYREIVKEV